MTHYGIKEVAMTLLFFTSCAQVGGGTKKDSLVPRGDGDGSQFRGDASDQGSSSSSQLSRGDHTLLASSSDYGAENDFAEALRDLDKSTPSINSAKSPTYLPKIQRKYGTGTRLSREDFVDHVQEEGSLWPSSGQTNYFFTKNRVRSAGDLISLVLDEELYRDITEEMKRTLSYPEREIELNLAQNAVKNKFISDRIKERRDKLAAASVTPENPQGRTEAASSVPKAAPSGTPTSDENAVKALSMLENADYLRDLEKLVPRATPSDVDLGGALDLKVGDSLMGEILERFPNGNYKIRAVKKVNYKNGSIRIVSVVGIAKNSDISEENDSIRSGRLYEHQVEVGH
jgi:flagellar basal body L-ring protein FlgH